MNISAGTKDAPLVDSMLALLEPLVALKRKAITEHGCFRNISSTQLHVLFVLVNEGTLPMSRLAERLDVSLPNVTGIVERMVERGFVERGRDAEDRRIVTVCVSNAGRETVEEIDMIRRGQLAAVVSRLTPEQQERALRTFTELRLAAEAIETD